MSNSSYSTSGPTDKQFDIWLEAGRSEKNYWRDLWHYRELFGILAWRDVAVRYKQTLAGSAWAIVQPLLNTIVMTVIFGKVAGLPTEGTAPYAIMVFAALLPWQFFSNSLSTSSQSIVGNSNLISKVYFPRMIIPTSALVVAFVDFIISLVILLGMMLWYQFMPSPQIFVLPALVVYAFVAALGPGLIITALNVKYRDVRFVIPFIIQFGMYLSPVAYSSSVIKEKLGTLAAILYSLNPLVGLIDVFRWCIVGEKGSLNTLNVTISCVMSAVTLVVGVIYFRRTEKSFADII